MPSGSIRSVLLAAGFLWLAGCSSSTSDVADGGGGDGGGGGGGAGAAEELPQGLFDCGFVLDCDVRTTSGSRVGGQCVAALAASGEPGIVRGFWTQGPFIDYTEALYLYLGD